MSNNWSFKTEEASSLLILITAWMLVVEELAEKNREFLAWQDPCWYFQHVFISVLFWWRRQCYSIEDRERFFLSLNKGRHAERPLMMIEVHISFFEFVIRDRRCFVMSWRIGIKTLYCEWQRSRWHQWSLDHQHERCASVFRNKTQMMNNSIAEGHQKDINTCLSSAGETSCH